jgi:hypothetical protein
MDMSPEAVAIVGVGVALLAVLVPLLLSIGRRIDRLEDRLNGRINRLEARIEELARDLRALAERVARIEGAVCGPWRPPEPDPAGEKPA